MIKTVKRTVQSGFEDDVNKLLRDGFVLVSSSCNTFQCDDYPEETYWCAILKTVDDEN